jgi:hypothetical protein
MNGAAELGRGRQAKEGCNRPHNRPGPQSQRDFDPIGP